MLAVNKELLRIQVQGDRSRHANNKMQQPQSISAVHLHHFSCCPVPSILFSKQWELFNGDSHRIY